MLSEKRGNEIILPGGIRIGEQLRRDARIRPITGHLEKRCAEITMRNAPRARIVSNLLGEAVESVGDKTMDKKLAAELCIADRRHLMQQIGILLEGDYLWLNPTCEHCSMPFDIGFARSSLPIKPAGKSFPYTEITLRGKRCTLRVPNGADQEYIAEMEPFEAEKILLLRCISDVSEGSPIIEFVESLGDEEITAIEEALDDIAPDLGTHLDACCPDCGHTQIVEFDPYRINGFLGTDLYEEVHTLAMAYHWGEAEILALPTEDRHLYIGLVERNRGIYS